LEAKKEPNSTFKDLFILIYISIYYLDLNQLPLPSCPYPKVREGKVGLMPYGREVRYKILTIILSCSYMINSVIIINNIPINS